MKWLKAIFSSKWNDPPIKGLGDIIIVTELPIVPYIFDTETLVIKIDKVYVVEEVYEEKKWEVFRTQSVYEIPLKEINSKKDIGDVFSNSESNLLAAMDSGKTHTRTPLPSFPHPQQENIHQGQIDYIYFQVLGRLD